MSKLTPEEATAWDTLVWGVPSNLLAALDVLAPRIHAAAVEPEDEDR